MPLYTTDSDGDPPLYRIDGMRGDLAGRREDRARKIARYLSEVADDETRALSRHYEPPITDDDTPPFGVEAVARKRDRAFERLCEIALRIREKVGL